MENEIIEAQILAFLHKKRIWGNRHIPAERIYKRIRERRIHLCKIAIKSLLRKGMLIDHAKSYGAYSLNPKLKAEIEESIEKYSEIY